MTHSFKCAMSVILYTQLTRLKADHDVREEVVLSSLPTLHPNPADQHLGDVIPLLRAVLLHQPHQQTAKKKVKKKKNPKTMDTDITLQCNSASPDCTLRAIFPLACIPKRKENGKMEKKCNTKHTLPFF